MKLETSPKVTKSKRSLHWCRSISKKYLCRFYYSISQKVITLSGRRFITVSGVLLHYRAVITLSGVFYYIIGQLLQYRAFITLSVGTAVYPFRNVATLAKFEVNKTRKSIVNLGRVTDSSPRLSTHWILPNTIIQGSLQTGLSILTVISRHKYSRCLVLRVNKMFIRNEKIISREPPLSSLFPWREYFIIWQHIINQVVSTHLFWWSIKISSAYYYSIVTL